LIGIEKLTDDIVKTGETEVKQSETMLLIIMIVARFVVITTFLINGISIFAIIRRILMHTEALNKLLHTEDLTHDMEYLPAMKTQFPPWDHGRHKIFEMGKQVLDEGMMTWLMDGVFKQFIQEEEIMNEENYVLRIKLLPSSWEEECYNMCLINIFLDDDIEFVKTSDPRETIGRRSRRRSRKKKNKEEKKRKKDRRRSRVRKMGEGNNNVN
jgi:hypothetical protein